MLNSYKKNVKGVSTKIRRGNASRRQVNQRPPSGQKNNCNKGKVKGRIHNYPLWMYPFVSCKYKMSCFTAAANRRACLEV